jgi:hypothetical protein
VKPQRDLVEEKFERDNWWLFSRYRGELRLAIKSLEKILVRSRVSELNMIGFAPKDYICSEQTIIFAFNDYFHLSLLQSCFHEIWIRKNASTLRTDVRYIVSDVFETFPFPQSPTKMQFQTIETIGAEYHEHRRQIMFNRQIGLTQTYNLFNNPTCTDTDIKKLRDLHAEMDNAVLSCYGWQDIELKHNFYQNERGKTRFTIAYEARIELLNRLLDLNLSIAEQEQNGKKEVDT